MSDTTPRISAPLLSAAQAQKHVTHNEALLVFDALVNARILDRDLAASPASPADGDCYLVAAAPTGAWAGQAGRLAFCVDGGWRFYAPFVGLCVFVADEAAMLVYTASGWRDWASLIAFQNLPELGINTGADATNKLALKANAALFAALEAAGGGTGDIRLTLNKETASDTGSLLYQTSWSGRAEMGLAGDDDFHIKVSPDGAAWSEAMVISAADGAATFGGVVALDRMEATSGFHIGEGSWSSDKLLHVYKSWSDTSDSYGVYGLRYANVASDAPSARIVGLCGLASVYNVGSGNLWGWAIGVMGNARGRTGTTGTCTNAAAFYAQMFSAGTLTNRYGLYIESVAGADTRNRAIHAEGGESVHAGPFSIGKTSSPAVTLDVEGPVKVKSYTVAGLPSAAAGAGQIVFVGDESGGAVLAFSDGTDWRRVTDRAAVS